DVLNYIASISTYGGGAYPILQTIAKNFDLKTGRLIHLEDVFVPGYEQPLKDRITEAACKKFKVKDLEELKKAYIFADGNVYVPDNFILTEDDITFIYCEDEVAPHAVGEIRLTFDKDDLSKILK
ncbi:MAG: RsiV family protein, partial [Prevotella sp.]|nr:RsiV family protein [Prevotella sp.]